MAINNPEFQCAIYMREHGVNVFSTCSDVAKILADGPFVPFIPEYRFSPLRADTDYSLIYVERDQFSVQLKQEGKLLELTGTLRDVEGSRALPYAIHFLTEQQRQANSQATIRGAGVSTDETGILLIGKRGSGKTSISLELCRRYDHRLVGADLVLIGLRDDVGYLFGGTKIFTLRFATVKHYGTELQSYFDEKDGADEWINKIDLLPEQLQVGIDDRPVKLTKAFYVHLVNDPKAPLLVKRVDTPATFYMGRLYLYEQLTRYIRGTCIPLFKGNDLKIGDYLPPLDSPDYHRWRVRLMDWLIDDLGLSYISGSMDAICDHIVGH